MHDYVPSEFYLGQNYPNPFRGDTTIKYCVPYKTRVKLTVFNPNGEMIKKLVDEVKEAGTYEVEFSAKVQDSESVKSEKYFCCFEAGDFSNTKTITLKK